MRQTVARAGLIPDRPVLWIVTVREARQDGPMGRRWTWNWTGLAERECQTGSWRGGWRAWTIELPL